MVGRIEESKDRPSGGMENGIRRELREIKEVLIVRREKEKKEVLMEIIVRRERR